jgi:3'-phosphoadenosine 5'-phosphosulfate sulfotransferase (PAPS reductase)/FAD synthetase
MPGIGWFCLGHDSMSVIHVVSVSGGKDSTATLLLALERFGRDRIIPIFMDTGNEHSAVHEYLSYLEQALDITIRRFKADFSDEIKRKRMFIARDQRTKRDKRGRKLRWTNKAKRRALAVLHPTGNPYLDLCLWKGRFPSRKAQFCTEELKRNVAVEFQMELVDQGYTVVSWQGIRRDESQARKNAAKFEKIGPRMFIYRPIVEWSAMDVFEYCRLKGIQPNPLYKQGMNRVGCMPCINCGKEEIRQIAVRFPEYMDEKAEWEILVGRASKHGFSTFFHKGNDDASYHDRHIYLNNRIHAVIEWAKTSRGGVQFDMLADMIDPVACSSAYGLCDG